MDMRSVREDQEPEAIVEAASSIGTRVAGSLRVRLLLLVALAIVPVVALIVYSAWDRRQEAEDRARQDAIDLTHLAVLQQDQTVDGSRQLLVILAGLTRAANLETIERAACDGVLLGFLNEFTSYEEIGIALPDGNVACSALPVEGQLNVEEESWFRRTLEMQAFSVGDYQVSSITGNPTVNVGYPVLTADGVIKAVLFLSFQLDWLNETVALASLPEGADFVLFDRNGVILARHPGDDGSSLGQTFDVGVALLDESDGTANVLEGAGADGINRLYGFTAASRLDERGLFAAVGVPTSTAFANINTDLRRNLVGLGIVAALAFAAAWLIGDLLVLRQTRDLVNVSRKLASGDFTARSRFAGGHGELDMLGRAFDDMATSLERREAEREEVEASQRRASAAEERDRFKTFLLSTVSHELRTPIAVIKGYASTLAEYSDRLDDAEKAEYWEAIISHSDRLDSLVSDLLLISNAESGRLPLSVGAIEVAPLVEEVVKSFQQLNGDRKFVFESKTASLEADRSRLRQVLDNLIGNAIKYSPQQSPIEVRAWETDGEVSVCVRDYGPGLPEETLEGIFEPFSRGQNAQQHSVQGYGLGLAICRAIVQAHHGRIWASLPEGGGLAVTFALPAVDSS